MTKPTVLLVDYDPASIQSVMGSLTQAGYDVVVAKNGPAGLDAFQRISFDLVLTQMILPKFAGLDLCREIRKSRPAGRPPILVFGTTPAEKGRAQALAAGADGYIVAPIDLEMLLEACDEHLAGSGPSEEGESFSEPSAAASEETAAGESMPAAVAAEILERLDALLPSTPIDALPSPAPREAAPEQTTAPARPARVQIQPTREDPAPPNPELRQEKPAPRAAPAVPRPVPASVATEASPRAGSPWGKVLVGVALAAGLTGAVLYSQLGSRARPARGESGDSDAGRPALSETVAREPEAPAEGAPNAPIPPDGAGDATAGSPPGNRPAEARPEPPRAGATAEPGTRPESAGAEPMAVAPAKTASTGGVADARSHPREPAPVSSPEPETTPAPAGSPAAAGERDGTAAPVPAAPPEPAAPELPGAATAPPPPAVQPGDFVESGSVDSPPVAKTRTQPAYPELARRMRASGAVTLRILVDETGAVTAAEPEDAAARKDFIAAAIRAVKSWTYTPATKNGVPVKTRVTVRIEFQP